MMKALAISCLLATLPATAHADDGDPSDRERAMHAGLIAGMAGTYLVVEFAFGSDLSPKQCRWCNPDGFDVSARNALKWQNTSLANNLSTATGYVGTPVLMSGLLVAGGWGRGGRRHFDDVAPVFESALAAGLLQHISKFSVGRQRPYAHYAAPGTLVPTEEDNVSFWSGHTTLAFSLAVSAGSVASTRGYRIAPFVWVTGLSLAAATGYLRIAADKHYAVDVLTGAAMGSLVGYVWPRVVTRYLHRDSLTVAPTPSGIAVLGRF
jgi:membrane-associated phospholipid phosphatase